MPYIQLALIGIGFLLGSTTTYLYKENEIKKIYLQVAKKTQENQIATNEIFENHSLKSKEIIIEFNKSKKEIELKELDIEEKTEYFKQLNQLYAPYQNSNN
jgi:hypothetical protein